MAPLKYEIGDIGSLSEEERALAGRNLKLQSGWSYEVGYKAHLGDSAWSLALYKMNFDNILINATSEKELKSHKINGGAFKNIGLDINYAKKINDHWTVQLGLTLSNPEAQKFSSYVKGFPWEQIYPKVQGHFNLQYKKGKLSYGIAFNGQFKRPKELGPKIDVNMNASYAFDKDNEVNLYLNNILNRRDIQSL